MDFYKQISINQVACPLHILQLKKGLKTMKKIRSTEGHPRTSLCYH